MKRLGLIVNPMAGIGGRVGLKGSDGDIIRAKAFSLGAKPEAPKKVIKALERLVEIKDEFEIVTCPGDMGENEAGGLGFKLSVIEGIATENTSADDTKKAAEILLAKGVDLILFAGGDGTARDICSVVGLAIPVLGIPAGVKIHSGVYGATPAWAGLAASMYLQDSPKIRLREAEVMDIDEEEFRNDRVSAKLYGYMQVPYERRLVQSAKAGSVVSENTAAADIASHIITEMDEDTYYIIGPGTTTREILKMCKLPSTLLGVDVIRNGEIVLADANERALLELLEDVPAGKAKLFVTVIGGQGYVFGRGNQQLSAAVIKKIGKENITIIATETKMLALDGRPLLVDTGDDEVNQYLCGYYKVITSMKKFMAYKVSC